jgi:aspartyl-tRNA(Asn)/glutamyl-tRNA(Gln) amidotransferase subunit A
MKSASAPVSSTVTSPKISRRQFALMIGGAAAAHSLSYSSLAWSASADELASLTLADAAAKVRSGAITAVQLTEACLSRINTYDPKLDAFITVMKDKALAQAKELDAEAKAGKFRGPLHGVPLGIKDIIDTAGTRTTGASALFADRVPEEDAPVVARLMAAGGIIVGKTNTQEFAMGGGETSYWGPSRNPWNLAHNTGGSSSGSGAALAANLCFGALGTDTGGSVRMPASFCGIVGLKATYGLIPIRGILPLTVSMDHCGPMTRTVLDNAIMMNVLAGYDKYDFTSVEHTKEDYVAALKQPISGLRLGIPVGYFDHVDPEVMKAIEAATALLAKMTQGAKEVALPSVTSMPNLGQLGETLAFHEEYVKRQAGRYMLPERRRLESALGSNLRATEYIRAKWEVETLRRKVDDAFTDFDLVVLPTQKILPPTLTELVERAHDTKPSNPRVTSNCQPFNVMGLPAISIPCGFSKSGLPIGLMIVGPRFSEGKVLALANAYEQATEWHKRKPPLTPSTPKPVVKMPA